MEDPTLAELANAAQRHIVGLERKLNQLSARASEMGHYYLAHAAKEMEGEACVLHSRIGVHSESFEEIIWPDGETRRGGR